MNLSEIFAQLTYGEFSQLSLGGADAGVIDATNYKRVVSHVNLGLIALYKRFPLKEGRLRIQLVPGRSTYPLTRAYAVSNVESLEGNKYLLDSVLEPFLDDILKVERVYTAADREMGLNDSADPYAVHTPSAAVLHVSPLIVAGDPDVPDCLKTSTLQVVYRANHPQIVVGDVAFDPAQVEVELPYTHLEPLLYYVASRVHNPIGLVNEFNAGNNYYAKYEASCLQLVESNLRVDQGSQNYRLHCNGWV